MGILDFILKKFTSESTKSELEPTQFEPLQPNLRQFESNDSSFNMHIEYNRSATSTIKVQTQNETYEFDSVAEYVCLSTSGDENVCPMCAQFEGKFFPGNDAPELPLCPSCACDYEYYDKRDLPSGSTISSTRDFTLPAKCTSMIYEKQQMVYREKDINKQIELCREQLKKIHEFMEPYISAGFPAPAELACRDFLPELYMKMGKWTDAENVIKLCIDAQAYSPEDGSEQLADFESSRKVATETLTYIQQNPGCLQRNIYKAMGYIDEEKELLKQFLRNSTLIEKEKYNNTNKLYCKEKNSL